MAQNADLMQLDIASCLPAQLPRYFTKNDLAAHADAVFDSQKK